MPPKSPIVYFTSIIPFEERERRSAVKKNWISSRTAAVSHVRREEKGEKSFRREREGDEEGLTALMQSGYYLSNPAEECLQRLYK